MFVSHVVERLTQLKWPGMLAAFQEQLGMTDITALSFEERLGLLLDREKLQRENRWLERRIKQAHLRQSAVIEGIDFRSQRGIDKAEILSLASCEWVRRQQNIIITGPTGIGKTYLACALAQKACREEFTASYYRLPRLLHELSVARGDGTYDNVLKKIAKIDVLVFDDWGLAVLTEPQRKDILEILEDRYQLRSTIITTQLPIEKWHEVIGDPTIADAILDRVVHNSYKLTMKGDSMRKKLHPSKLPT